MFLNFIFLSAQPALPCGPALGTRAGRGPGRAVVYYKIKTEFNLKIKRLEIGVNFKFYDLLPGPRAPRRLCALRVGACAALPVDGAGHAWGIYSIKLNEHTKVISYNILHRPSRGPALPCPRASTCIRARIGRLRRQRSKIFYN